VNEVATAPAPSPTREPAWGIPDAVVGWFVVYLLSSIWAVAVLAITGHVGDDLDDVPLGVVALAQLGLALGFFLVPWFVTRVKGNGVVADLGLRVRGADVWRGGLLGIVGQLALIPLLYWPLLELLDKDVDDLEGPAQTLTDRANGPVDVLLLVLIVGVLAPVFEELFYRGLVQRSLLKRGLAPVVAVGITSLWFAATHFQLLQLPGLFLAGVLFGTLAYRSGRLGPAIAAHVTFNMVTVISLLAVG
jgi:membrane protease YdiL (CAAX protease family)